VRNMIVADFILVAAVETCHAQAATAVLDKLDASSQEHFEIDSAVARHQSPSSRTRPPQSNRPLQTDRQEFAGPSADNGMLRDDLPRSPKRKQRFRSHHVLRQTAAQVEAHHVDFVSFVPHLHFSPDEGYGYGWLIADTDRGTRVLFHNGAESGIEYYASLRQFVDEDVIVILLSNAPEDLTWGTEAGRNSRDVSISWRLTGAASRWSQRGRCVPGSALRLAVCRATLCVRRADTLTRIEGRGRAGLHGRRPRHPADGPLARQDPVGTTLRGPGERARGDDGGGARRGHRPGRQRVDVPILDIFGNTASVRVDADAWIDDMHLPLWNGD
jgi:hypothetical protein